MSVQPQPPAHQRDELRAAIATGRLCVYYQPIIDVQDNVIVGGEALLRWHHPDRGVLAASDFAGLAADAGLLGELGELALRQACTDVAGWPLIRANRARVTVTVSGRQLREPTFGELVVGCLARHALPAHRLVLKVDEATLTGTDQGPISTLNRLRKHGVRIAIDGVAGCYPDLSVLAGRPVDLLCVQPEFVTTLETSSRSRAVLRGLLAMAADLGLRTVVDGVQTPLQARIVAAMGAHEGQGWLWGRPASSADFPSVQLAMNGQPGGRRTRIGQISSVSSAADQLAGVITTQTSP